jgi:hypothetical protein
MARAFDYSAKIQSVASSSSLRSFVVLTEYRSQFAMKNAELPFLLSLWLPDLCK